MARCPCGAEVVWATSTKNRRPVMVDPQPTPGHGNVLLEDYEGGLWARVVGKGQGTHVLHFATCPRSEEFRRRRSR